MALSAYDFRDHPELVRIAEEEFAPAIPLDKKETIQNACEYGNFAENMQVAPLNPDKAETMTLGELAKLGENDNNQRLDVKSIRNLGFGPQGMITRGKQKSDLRMLEMPRVLYRQEGEGEHAKFVESGKRFWPSPELLSADVPARLRCGLHNCHGAEAVGDHSSGRQPR